MLRVCGRWIRLVAVCAGVAGAGVGGAAPAWAQGSVPVPAAPGGPSEKTVAALRAAHTALSEQARVATQAAAKADAEQLAGMASLLRGASRSMTVSVGLIAEQIRALKGEVPGAPGGPAPEIKGTKEALAQLLSASTKLKDTDLPAWRREAEGEGQRGAVRVLRAAREAQIELGRIYKDFGGAPETAGKSKRDVFVSRSCGYLVEKLDLQRCPVCSAGRDDFEKVN
jgi:rubrerythrin